MENEREKTVKALSLLTGLSTDILVNCNRTYKTVKIPKDEKKTKFRTLHIPNPALMMIQKVILEKILYCLPVSDYAHCSVPKRSVVTNASPHLKSKSFFRIDFKDAFPSTTQKMVSSALESSMYGKTDVFKDMDCHSLAILISELTTYKNCLPQGASTSPYLLNIVCHKLDEHLLSLIAEHKLVYTRYADDLWFSSEKSGIPQKIRTVIINTVKFYGFIINRDKILYKIGKATVPKITGTTITKESLGIPRRSIEQYRAKIYKAVTDLTIPDSDIFGIIAWVTMVLGKIPQRLKGPFEKFLESRCPGKKQKFIHYFSL